MNKTPDRCCQRCHLPLAPEEQEHSDGFVLSKHTEAQCISRLLDELTAMRSAESVEMDKLRKLLAAERKAEPGSVQEALKLSGAVARTEEWIKQDIIMCSAEISIEADGTFNVRLCHQVYQCPKEYLFFGSAATFTEALTAALDEADGV